MCDTKLHYDVSLIKVVSIISCSIGIFFIHNSSLNHLIFAAGKPTKQQLIKIKKKDGTRLRIIDMFALHKHHQLEYFANMLLNDNTKVKTLRRQHGDNEEEFIREVLYYWLDLDDDDPGYSRTWEALGKCVSDAGLDGTFAKAIRETYYPGVCVCVCVCVRVCVNTL